MIKVSFIQDAFNVFFPNECAICQNLLVKNEDLLCVKCRFSLPLAEVSDIKDNFVEKTFYGRARIEFATSLLLYKRKNSTQKLIHQLKYKNKENIGIFLGSLLGAELKECKRLPKIDYVIPVPLHKKRLKSRGYNQVAKFGIEIAKNINATYLDNCLKCVSISETQTLKQRLERWRNVENKFMINDEQILKGKSILLVDDVITTGATLEACCIELKKIDNIKISIATMAFTS